MDQVVRRWVIVLQFVSAVDPMRVQERWNLWVGTVDLAHLGEEFVRVLKGIVAGPALLGVRGSEA